ncbi:hypothetical protein HNQ56_000951 [Anaerotaenia torta]|uniref:hypothetical protein n=1 Tax=Anaerotaenia torta TaxID=433293 RepID=UPI003D24CCFB
MKIYHFILIFLIFFFAAVIKTDIQIGEMKEIEREKAELTESLDSAASDAIDYLAASGSYGINSIEKEKVISTFFTSLYASLGIISDRNKQAELELYIPVILLCDADGFYVYYYEDYEGEYGEILTQRMWSEKMPYFYQDADFIYGFSLADEVDLYDTNNLFQDAVKVRKENYHLIQTEEYYKEFRKANPGSILLNDEVYHTVRKTAIMSQLEEVLSFYTNQHNYIARQHGITYQFSFPPGQEEEWAQYLDDVNLVVVFQGYPYGTGQDYTCNKIASSGANVLKKPIYFVEERSWYFLAHKAGCPKLIGNTMILEEAFDSLLECAKIGAYCDDCIENGARVPILK